MKKQPKLTWSTGALKSVSRLTFLTAVGFCALAAGPAQADTFDLTSCHISTGCPAAGTVFGTVTLSQTGGSVYCSAGSERR
jgi:hypothetical protein